MAVRAASSSRISTRSVLQVVGIVLITLSSAVGVSGSKPAQKECRKTDVLVLGAGAAGITAAKALSKNSINDFIILEYQDRIGGRAQHTEFGKKADGAPYVVELGANWVQGLGKEGGPENPIWTLAKKYNLSNTYSDFSSLETFDETGPIDYTHLIDEIENAWTQVEQDAGLILSENLQDRSFRTGLSLAGWNPKYNHRRTNSSMNTTSTNITTSDAQTSVQRARAHAQAAEWWEFDFEYAFSPEESSQEYAIVNYNTSFYHWSDENNFVWDERGFSAFIEGEAGTFLKTNQSGVVQDERLLLQHVVQNISYTDEGVTVYATSPPSLSSSDNDEDDTTCFSASYAICTFSLGVLQSQTITFSPPLPTWKQTAVHSFQMGTYTKIFLQFPPDRVFWNTSTQFFLYAAPSDQGRGYFPLFQNLDHEDFLPGSGILFVTVVSDAAYAVEGQDDATTLSQILDVLTHMYPNQTIPEPMAFMYPRWSDVPWSYGSYSNWPVGTSLKTHQNLRANVGRVFFAGEAGHPEFFGFLQGAYYEGKEVGERVARCLGGDEEGCGMRKYERVAGSTPKEEYNGANGWDVDSFATEGVDE